MIVIIARYRARPDTSEQVAALLREYVPQVQGEPGCAGFVAHRNRDDPDEFLLYERYHDQAAVDAHRASSHFAAIARDRIIPLLAERTVAFYDELAGG